MKPDRGIPSIVLVLTLVFLSVLVVMAFAFTDLIEWFADLNVPEWVARATVLPLWAAMFVPLQRHAAKQGVRLGVWQITGMTLAILAWAVQFEQALSLAIVCAAVGCFGAYRPDRAAVRYAQRSSGWTRRLWGVEAA